MLQSISNFIITEQFNQIMFLQTIFTVHTVLKFKIALWDQRSTQKYTIEKNVNDAKYNKWLPIQEHSKAWYIHLLFTSS